MNIKIFQPLLAAMCLGIASADVLVSWGPAFDILNNRQVSMQNSTTSTPAGTINSDAGTFLYRSHMTAIITNQTYDNAPASPDFGWATSSWRTGTSAPSLFSRIEGRDANAPNGDFYSSAIRRVNPTMRPISFGGRWRLSMPLLCLRSASMLKPVAAPSVSWPDKIPNGTSRISPR